MNTIQRPNRSSCHVLALASLLALTLGARAQDPAPPTPVRPGGALAQVHVDTPGDGNAWVLAPGYKARVGSDAVEFFPYFGAKAEGLHPVRFRVRSVERGNRPLAFRADVAPVIEDLRVTYDRGPVREVWELRRDEVEQTFVVSDIKGDGDLVIRLDVQTELRAADLDTGLCFGHRTLGHVLYSDVVTIDPDGRRAASPARLCEGGIELRVPAAFVAASQGPLTIDPVVRTITVDNGTDLVGNPDVAFEPTTGNWLVAYVRQFSTTDSDIITRRFNSAGNLLEEKVVATGSRESGNPSVGANGPARQFLIAWDEDTAVADRVILGRTRDAASTTQGSTFTVRDTSGLGRDDIAPSVGGSIATDANGANYAVLCLSDNGNGRHVTFMRVSTAGGVQFRGIVSGGGHDVVEVRATKTRATDEAWLCVYARSAGSAQHVHFAEATVVGSVFRNLEVDSQADCRIGGIAGRAPEYLVVYSKQVGPGNSDIFGRSIRMTASSTLLRAPVNLTAIEPGAVGTRDQLRPQVAFDGCRYTYAYLESAGAAGSFDAYAAVVSAPDMRFSDGHRALPAPTTANELDVAIASTGEMGGPKARSFVVFGQINSGGIDVGGVLFDGVSPNGGITTLPTRCGNHQLLALDEPVLGGTVRLRATRSVTSPQVYLIGLPVPPIALCAQCSLGVGTILVTALGANIDLPIPCGSTLVGAEVAVQNLLVGSTAGCLPPATPVALVTSDTLVIRVR